MSNEHWTSSKKTSQVSGVTSLFNMVCERVSDKVIYLWQLKTTSVEVRKTILGQRVCPRTIQTQGHKTHSCIVFQNSAFGTQNMAMLIWKSSRRAKYFDKASKQHISLPSPDLACWNDFSFKGITMLTSFEPIPLIVPISCFCIVDVTDEFGPSHSFSKQFLSKFSVREEVTRDQN